MPTAPAPPKLLSGGNPQIAKADGDEPVRAYIAALPGWKHGIAKQLDQLIESSVPNVKRAVKWNSPFYGLEGTGWFMAMHAFTHALKVTFFKGTLLVPPPKGGKAKEARWVDLREGDLLDKSLKAWIEQAAALPGWSAEAKPPAASKTTMTTPSAEPTKPTKPPKPTTKSPTRDTDWRGPCLDRVRALIVEALPQAIEERKWRDVPVWSQDGIVCTGETYQRVVKLTFAKGALVDDPDGLFNASLEGKTRRAIDLHEGEVLNQRAFKALLKRAAAVNAASKRR